MFLKKKRSLNVTLGPKPLAITEQFRFHKSEQKDGENMKAYAASLQKLAEHCAFGDTLSGTLRDRLVCSMRDEAVQKHLLTMTDICQST